MHRNCDDKNYLILLLILVVVLIIVEYFIGVYHNDAKLHVSFGLEQPRGNDS